MRRKTLNATLVCALITMSGSAAALNLNFLQSDPARHFTDQDWELAGQAFEQALQAKDGESVRWSNPKLPHSGQATAQATYVDDADRTCRLMHVEHRARTMQWETTLTFCQDTDGTWRPASDTRARQD